MIKDKTIQVALLGKAEECVPTNLLFSSILMDVLGVSYSGAHRRIRDETQLTLKEAVTITIHYNISLDSLIEEFK